MTLLPFEYLDQLANDLRSLVKEHDSLERELKNKAPNDPMDMAAAIMDSVRAQKNGEKSPLMKLLTLRDQRTSKGLEITSVWRAFQETGMTDIHCMRVMDSLTEDLVLSQMETDLMDNDASSGGPDWASLEKELEESIRNNNSNNNGDKKDNEEENE